MSLEERIRRFAEQARGYLLEEFAKSLQQDTTVVKWQGYDQDGKLVVKNKDLTPTVDGVGQKYATKGSDLILDSTGSVEQRKARRRQPAPVPQKKLRAIPPQTLVPRNAMPIFFDEFLPGEFVEIFEVGDYILTYRKMKGEPISGSRYTYWREGFHDSFYVPPSGGAISFDVEVESVDRVNIINNSCNSDNCPPSSSTALGMDDGNIFSVVLATINCYSLEWFNSNAWSTVPNGSITVGNQTESFTDQSDYTLGIGEYVRKVVNYGVRQSVDFRVQGEMASGGGTIGEIEYVCDTYSCFVCDEAKYYYTFFSEGEAASRTIDLAPMVQEDIWEHDKIHEYRTREIVGDKEEVIVYNVFYVLCIDTGFQYERLDYEASANSWDDGYKTWWGGVGKIVPYFIHTKLNLTTGQISSKTTQCTVFPGLNYDGLTNVNGMFAVGYPRGLPLADITQETRELMGAEFPFGAFVVYSITNVYRGSVSRNIMSAVAYDTVRDMIDPSAIFSEAYSGDWISQITFDLTGYNSYTDFSKIQNFLNLSYYNGKFYGYKHGQLVQYPIFSPCSQPYQGYAAIEYNYGDLPSSMTVLNMESIRSNLVYDLLDNLLDLSTWGQYNATRYSSWREARTEKFYGPLFPILVGQYMFDYCYETHAEDTYFLHLLAQENLGYIFNDPILYDTVSLINYQITAGEVMFTTKFAHNFAVGDSVSITGIEGLTGIYSVTEASTNLNFKAATTATDTGGIVQTNGTATKQ